MRDDIGNSSVTGTGNRRGMGGGMMAALVAAIFVMALLAFWQPWSERSGVNSTGLTGGSSNTASASRTTGTPGAASSAPPGASPGTTTGSAR